MVGQSDLSSGSAHHHRRLRQRVLGLDRRVQRAIGLIAGVRLVGFLTALVCGFSAVYAMEWLPYGPFALAGAIIFGIAAWRHGAPYALAPKIEMRLRMADEAIARREQDWDAAGDDGADYLSAVQPGLGELQVFGRGSLFQLINRTGLPWGRDHLAALLADGVGHQEVAQRQEAAKELEGLSVFRHRVEAESRVADVDRRDLDALLDWAEAEPDLGWLDTAYWASLLLVPATLVLAGLRLAEGAPSYWYITFLLQLLIFGVTTGRLSAQYVPLIGSPKQRPIVALRHVFARIERRKFDSEFLQECQSGLAGQGAPPSERIRRFERILDSLAVRHGPMLYAILAICALWEVIQCRNLERWRRQYGPQLRGDLVSLSEFEALVSVASFTSEHRDFSWPEVGVLRRGEAPIDATQLGHPLLARAERRCNDFRLDESGQLVLVTGSNMSGKSTFLRTLGVNVRLALMGGPVCAERLSMVECDLSTSIQVVDSPGEGMSRFYAEVKRLSGVLGAVESAQSDDVRPQLYLIDEMLSGTNSRERGIASKEIVRRLVEADRSFGLVTTHDLALVSIESELPGHIICYHFSDQFDGEALHFDYLLKSGVATTTNALHVLAMEGIEITADS